jgi:spore germination cell wall hydrolase CwlJ-like protein
VSPGPATVRRLAHARPRDLECLATAVYYEARGEAATGQAAVAQVVLNRTRRGGYPRSICAVVYQGANEDACQFSFVCNGAMRGVREAAAWTRARRVAARALGGYVMSAVGRATCFHAVSGGSGGGRGLRLGGQVFS